MIDGAVLHLCDAYSRLTEQIAVLRLAPMAELTADERKWFVEFAALKEIMARREILGDDGLQSAVHILVLRLRGNAFFNREMLARELEACRSQFLICLSKRKFAYIRPPGEAYFEKADLLGVESFLMIPDARDDVRDAGNCMAAQAYRPYIAVGLGKGIPGLPCCLSAPQYAAAGVYPRRIIGCAVCLPPGLKPVEKCWTSKPHHTHPK
jgi:hypothetical protein